MASTLLVKRVGRPQSAHQDLVWPGSAVNYAVKAGQCGDVGELVVTGSVWDAIANNDYLTFTCDCATPSPGLWSDRNIEKLDHDDVERCGRVLKSSWCTTCGESYCEKVLAGETHRDAVDDYRSLQQSTLFREAIAKKYSMERASRRNLRRARTGR